MPAAWITRAYFADSLVRNSANRAGVLASTTMPCADRFLRVSGSMMILLISALIVLTVSRGVADDTSMPYQFVMSKPFRPCSAMVGICGAVALRCDVVT